MEKAMTEAVLIGGWAWLFCGPLTEGNMIFSWLPPLVRLALNGGQRKTLEAWAVLVYLPLTGCGKCHAFWLALAFYGHKAAETGSAIFGFWHEILAAVLAAAILEKWLK
jgi:hypothetical protein